ncbi:MAG: lipopolysaccharide biosynthesis protein [Planctomycetota bacterium]
MSEPHAQATPSLRQAALRGTLWFGIAQVFDRLVQAGVLFVLARLLGGRDFGLIAQAMVPVALLQLLVGGGFTAALVQRRTLGRADADTVFWINLGLSGALTALALWVAPAYAGFVHEPMLSPVLSALSVVLPISALSVVQEALLSRELRFAHLALRQTVGNLAGVVAALIVAWLEGGVWALVMQQVATRAVSTAALWVSSPWRPTLRFEPRAALSLTTFGGSIVGTRLAQFGATRAHEGVIGWKLPTSAVGDLFLAGRLVQVLGQAVTLMVARVALPTFSKMGDDVPRIERAYRSAVRSTAAITLPVFVGLAVFAPEAMALSFGPTFAPAWPVLVWLSLGAVVGSINSYNTSVLVAVGRPSLPLYLQLANAATHLGTVVAVALIVFSGDSGWSGSELGFSLTVLAAAMTIRRWLFWPVQLWVLRASIGLRLGHFLGSLLGPFGATVLAAVSVLFWRSLLGAGGSGWLGAGVVTFGVLYVVSLVLLAPAMAGSLFLDVEKLAPAGIKRQRVFERLRRYAEAMSSRGT